MDANVKKTVLRMIPYGLYVLTAESPAGISAATVITSPAVAENVQ